MTGGAEAVGIEPAATPSPATEAPAVPAADLVGNAPRVAAEAVQLLSAPELPERVTTVILDGQQLSLQVHESVGHPLELDRIMGMEAAYAGTSFVRPEDRVLVLEEAERVDVLRPRGGASGDGAHGCD